MPPSQPKLLNTPQRLSRLFFLLQLTVFTGSIKDLNPPRYVMATVHIVLFFAAFAAVSFVVSMFYEMEWRRWLGFISACCAISAFGLWITMIAGPIVIIGWGLALCAPMFFIEWLYRRYKSRNGGTNAELALCERLSINPMMIRFGYVSDIDGSWYKLLKDGSSTTLSVEMLNDDELWFYHIKEKELLKKWEEDFYNDETNSHPYPEDFIAYTASRDEIRKRHSFHLNELIELYSHLDDVLDDEEGEKLMRKLENNEL